MIIKDTESVDIHMSTGSMRTHLFRPVTEGRYPGLLLYSEIFQVTGPIRRTAAMLASQGFVVAVPEIDHELEPTNAGVNEFERGPSNRGQVTPIRGRIKDPSCASA
jgi:carboxymethylenebutenolidase